MRFWGILLLIFVGLSADAGSFRYRGGEITTFSLCPNGFADPNDGCTGANPFSTVTFSNLFTSIAPQSGQSYFAANPGGDGAVVTTTFNLPGVTGGGYPVGPYTARSKANDPQAAAFSLGTTSSYITSDGVLHVTGTPAASINFGQTLTGSTVSFGTEVIGSSTYGPAGYVGAATCGTSLCTGAGASGTYLTSNAGQTVGSIGAQVTLTAHNFPNNCTLTAPTGSFGDYGLLNCGGTWSGNYTWENVDFGPVNGHGPTVVFAGVGQAVNFNLYDYWITNAVGTTTGTCLGRSVNTGSIFYIESGTVANVQVKWGNSDGGGASCRYILGQGVVVVNTTGSVSFQYNYMSNTEGLPIGIHPGQTGTSDFSFNVFRNWGFGEWQSHAEIDGIAPIQNTLLPNFNIGYNVAWNDVGTVCACATTNIYLTGGVNGFNFNTMNVTRNVLVSNPISGTNNFGNTATITYTFSPNPTGTPVAPGPYLVVTSITCTGACNSNPYVLQGMTITDNNIEIGLDQCTSGCTNTGPNGLPKGGVGSVWTAPCSIANTVCPVYGVTNSGSISCTPSTNGCNNVSYVDFDFSSTTSALTTVGSSTLNFSGPIPGCTVATSPTGLCNTNWTSGQSAKTGQFVFDRTNPAAIPPNTVISSFTGNNINLSNATVAPGVASGDTIEFEGLGCVSGIGFCTAKVSDLISAFGPSIEQSHSSIATLSITGNLFDTTGMGGGPMQAIDGSGTCGSPATLTGNLNFITAASVNSWTTNTAGC